MCNEGWSVALGQEGGAWGGTVWNTLKDGETEKRGGFRIRIYDPICIYICIYIYVYIYIKKHTHTHSYS